MPATRSMNFQAYLEDTYRIIKEEPVILILGGLLAQLLSIVSLGILAGPFMGGYTLLVILYLRENKKPAFGDIFSGLKQFANLFPYFLVLLLIFFGFMLFVLPGLLLATWWLYVLPLMVDRKMSFIDAMRLSMKRVNEAGFLMHFVFVLLIYVIPIILIESLTAIIPFAQLLKIILPPFQIGCLACLYIDQFEEFKESDSKQRETDVGTVPVTLPQEEKTAYQVEEESMQPEQPASEDHETPVGSDEDFPAAENTPDEKLDQENPDTLDRAADKPEPDSEKDNKDTV